MYKDFYNMTLNLDVAFLLSVSILSIQTISELCHKSYISDGLTTLLICVKLISLNPEFLRPSRPDFIPGVRTMKEDRSTALLRLDMSFVITAVY